VFIAALAGTYADINALHPFREGNGRTQRAFLQQLARGAGHPLSWANLSAAENENASIAGFRGDLGPLVTVLDKVVQRDE
jgi:cell filamentation protein